MSACYDVYFRALGTPGGNATITTCGVLAGTTTIVCDSGNSALVSRNKGTPTFSKVTNQLTSIFGKELFNSDFQFFLWQYDNQGLKNGMVVFCGANCGG